MTFYSGNGTVSILAPLNDGIEVKLNTIIISAKIPSLTSLSLIVYNGDTFEQIKVIDSLYDGDNVITVNKIMKNIKLVFKAVGVVYTPTFSVYVNYSSIVGEINIPANTVNYEHYFIDKIDVFGYYNGAMVYFPDGCKSLVEVKLKYPKSNDTIPDNSITISDGIIGDGEIKFIHIDKIKLRRGEGLATIISNYDDVPHKVLVYPEIEYGSGGKYDNS